MVLLLVTTHSVPFPAKCWLGTRKRKSEACGCFCPNPLKWGYWAVSSFPKSSCFPSQEYDSGIREMKEMLETMRDVFPTLEYSPLVGHEMHAHHDTRVALRGQLARACSFSHHVVPRMGNKILYPLNHLTGPGT